MEIIVIVGVCVMLAAGIAGIVYAVATLMRSERKKKMPDVKIPPLRTVVTSSVGFYDTVTEEIEPCRVQCLKNSATGEESFAWQRRPMPLFVCDRRKCENCDPSLCSYTSDVEHAANFHRDGDFFVEDE